MSNDNLKLNHKHLFWMFALLTGFSFDLLFRNQSFGLNFFIFVTLATLSGLIPIWLEKIKIPWQSYLLLIPVAFFAALTFIRAEPFTTVVNVLLTLACLILFVLTLRNGAWHHYRLFDYFTEGFRFLINSLTGGVLFFTKTDQTATSTTAEVTEIKESASENAQKAPTVKRWIPYLRGVLLTLPIVIVLALLLAQADPIFSDRLKNITAWLTFEDPGDILSRSVTVLIIAYGLLSASYFALVKSKKFNPDEKDRAVLKPFLGTIESCMILGGVNLLFLLFVILQFSYLFNGGQNINLAGYTYAEYARRGFFELILVSIISLILFYSLSTITNREADHQRRIFSASGLLLVGLVAIILVSAYTRLTLYEAAYGFTRLRTFAHILMVWIGLLLVGVAFLEVTRKMPRLAFLLICLILGFGMTINLLNMDAFIAQRNVTRAVTIAAEENKTKLDSGYLTSLSADTVPPLVQFFEAAETPAAIKNEIGGILACRLAMLNHPESDEWRSFHVSRSQERTLLAAQAEKLNAYPVFFEEYTFFVEVNTEVKSCFGYEMSLYD